MLIPSAFVVFLHVRVSYFSGITELNDSKFFVCSDVSLTIRKIGIFTI